MPVYRCPFCGAESKDGTPGCRHWDHKSSVWRHRDHAVRLIKVEADEGCWYKHPRKRVTNGPHGFMRGG